MHRFNEAWENAREGLELALRLDAAMPTAWAIGHLAEVAAETGDPTPASLLLGYCDAAYRKTGSRREPTEQRGYDRTMLLIRGALGEEQITALMAEGGRTETGAAAEQALAVPCPRAHSTA
jgi:hypothetical protein